MKLDLSVFQCVVSIVVHRQRLSHANHSGHVYGRDNVGVSDCSCQRHCGSTIAIFSVFQGRHPPLTAIRAVAPAAEEVVAILRPPTMPPENHAAEVGYAQQCDCIVQVAGAVAPWLRSRWALLQIVKENNNIFHCCPEGP